MGDSSAKFVLVDVVGFASIFHEFFWHSEFGCFHGVCQHLIHRISLDEHWCVGSTDLGQGIPRRADEEVEEDEEVEAEEEVAVEAE